MNQLELKNMIDEIHVMADILSDEYKEDVRRDVMVAISVAEQKNLFWMVDSIEKLRGHIRRKKYELTDEDRLWSRKESFNVKSLSNACEIVLLKCGWIFDYNEFLWKKRYKIDSYVEYKIEPSFIPKNCIDIPMGSVIVNNIPVRYRIEKMTNEYIEFLTRDHRGIGYYIIVEWNNRGFKKESALFRILWNDALKRVPEILIGIGRHDKR